MKFEVRFPDVDDDSLADRAMVVDALRKAADMVEAKGFISAKVLVDTFRPPFKDKYTGVKFYELPADPWFHSRVEPNSD